MKWGIVKQARQQAKRMEKKMIYSDALREYQNAERILKEKYPRGKKRTELMQLAAQQFMESGFARESDILANMSKEISEGDPKRAAEYKDANRRLKEEMEARHFAGSETIQAIADNQGAYPEVTTDQFYEMLRKSAMYAYSNKDVSPDEIQAYIIKLYEKAAKGEL